MTTPTTFREQLRHALNEALSMVLPINCAGCGEPDYNLCQPCRDSFQPLVQYRELFDEHSARRLPLWYSMELTEVLNHALHQFKDRGRTSIAKPLGILLRPAVSTAVAALKVNPAEIMWVLPPTSRANFRQRGYVPIVLLAKAAGLPTTRLLAIRRRRADQSKLGRMERFTNMRGVYVARGVVAGKKVVLVDDVMTTGATLLECARALRAGGADVLGAVVIAYTPKNFQDTRRKIA